MSAVSTQLLKLLGSGVRPNLPTASATPASGATSFASLLQQARDGSLTSAAPVSVNSDSGVKCNDDQLARLSLGADKLEAAGVRTALVNIDGQQLVMDVHARQITGSATAQNGVVSGIDGVIDLGDNRGATAAAGIASQIGAGIAQSAGTAGATPFKGSLAAQNQSLLQLLAGLPAA